MQWLMKIFELHVYYVHYTFDEIFIHFIHFQIRSKFYQYNHDTYAPSQC